MIVSLPKARCILRLTNDMLNCIEITADELMKCTETFKTRKENVTVELVFKSV